MPTPVFGTRRRTKSTDTTPMDDADADALRFDPGPLRAAPLSDVDVSETSSDESAPKPKPTEPSLSAAAAAAGSPAVADPDDVVVARHASWAEVDSSIVLALSAPIGGWLTGGDHFKNLFLALLLVLYLHQLISVPWELYRASRARRPHAPHCSTADDDVDPELASLREAAVTELEYFEFFYLLLSASAPFLGAVLLRVVLRAASGPNELSWFSATLFVLATGVRPWSHIIARLRERTEALHDAVHYPSTGPQKVSDTQLKAIMNRIDALEAELAETRRASADRIHVDEELEDINNSLDAVESSMHKLERGVDATRTAHEARLSTLDKNVARALEKRRVNRAAAATPAGPSTVPAYAFAQRSAHPHTGALFAAAVRVLYYVWAFATLSFLFRPAARAPPPPAATAHRRAQAPHGNGKARARLETIPEDLHENPAGWSSGSDTELADTESARSASVPPSPTVAAPPAHSAADWATDAVTLPYRASLGILTAAARILS